MTILAAAGLYRPAGLEQGLREHLRRGDAHSVIGVHLVDRCARDRPGQLKLAARRHDAVSRGDHDRAVGTSTWLIQPSDVNWQMA